MRNIINYIINRIKQFISQRDMHGVLKPSVNENGVLFDGYIVEDRAKSSIDRVSIGKNSVLSCRIIFERDIGAVTIGNDSFVGGSQIICANKIDIGNDVLISWGCTIADHDSHSLDWRKRADDVRSWRKGLIVGGLREATRLKNWDVVETSPIHISDKVWIGMNSTILKGIKIGEGSVVAAGSMVTKDVPPWTLVAGNPARVIKDLSEYQ